MSKNARQIRKRDPKVLNKEQFAELMQFPKAWLAWGMYNDELFKIQLADCEPRSEDAPEHYRYGAFRWWLGRTLTNEELTKYVALTFLDPDQAMAGSARRDLASSKALSPELRALISLSVPV
jgi:hypothetical protein